MKITKQRQNCYVCLYINVCVWTGGCASGQGVSLVIEKFQVGFLVWSLWFCCCLLKCIASSCKSGLVLTGEIAHPAVTSMVPGEVNDVSNDG